MIAKLAVGFLFLGFIVGIAMRRSLFEALMVGGKILDDDDNSTEHQQHTYVSSWYKVSYGFSKSTRFNMNPTKKSPHLAFLERIRKRPLKMATFFMHLFI